MNSLMRSILLALPLGLLFALSAQAASVSVVLDRSDRPMQLPDGGDYLQVTISDGANGNIDFRVQSLEDLQDVQDNNDTVGISAFSFNLGNSQATINNVVGPNGWNVTGKADDIFQARIQSMRSRFSKSIFESGRDLRPRFELAADRMLGERFANFRDAISTRFSALIRVKATNGVDGVVNGIGSFGEFDVNLTQGAGDDQDPLEFSIVGVDGDTPWDYLASLSMGDAPRGNALFAAQVIGINIPLNFNEEDSRRLKTAAFGGGTVVPLPASMVLLVSATLVLGGIGVRRRKNEQPSDAQSDDGMLSA